MDDNPTITRLPAALPELQTAAHAAGFTMSCDTRTGSLLATLAATRPGGRILELGTGVGEGTAWLLSGMSETATLVTVELKDSVQDVARRHLGGDGRVTFVSADAGRWLEEYDGAPFDLVFADTWPGKFTHLDRALELVAPGGTYLIDDLTPTPGRPEGHEEAVTDLLAALEDRPGFRTTRLAWSSGLLIAVRVTGSVS
ncbi:methyltransferase domain-containing protein [Streptomyces ipomoeae]|uniref:Methyltransferase domain-containing protein n=1 Tax=Streptomyces ipomoeae TaxID=103232 RepID=A0AAE9AXE2_9ACTN|nr:class I SAM-dependent methyltransferase [Streptomyces ipomoeae]TQE21948.1 methyltransferase domain-containing protein [Streptomyces ipomoeae]TQE34923.1 methyltransferase domain-containing protein [Streptomyces ipomoeae]